MKILGLEMERVRGMLFGVLRLLFALFAKNVIADLLVIFRHVRKIEKKQLLAA